MRNKYSATALLLISAATAQVALGDTILEQKYIKNRNAFIQQYAKTTNLVDESPALAQLEKQLRKIVGPIKVEGFPSEGTINLETLQKNELGFGQVDGLKFESSKITIFVTTDTLLKYYLKEHSELPSNLDSLSKNGTFYQLTFTSDAAVTYYAELPIRTGAENKSFAHAFLGLTGQDIGPFPPEDIFVFVSKGGRVLMADAPVSVEVTDIPKCKKAWDIFSQRSSQKLRVYQTSEPTDEKAFDDHIRLEEQGFAAYTQCFGREAKDQRFFSPLTKQAENIAKLLLNN